jgi:signal transduction histidine kinase
VKRHSIRWRLPLSYAAIALLATLALGGVLLLTLQGHYLRIERDYLQSNAQAIGFSLSQLLPDDPPPETLQSHLDSLAYLSGTRVQLLDAGQQLVASSEPWGRVAVGLASERVAESFPLDARFLILLRPGDVPSTTITTEEGAPVWLPADPEGRFPLSEGELRRILPFPGGELRRIFPFPAETARFEAERADAGIYSSQLVQVPILGSDDELLGYIELSDGPAYAREIVGDVAWGWGIASAVAVALAAGVGWLISRQLSSPLLALTEVTASMADGDLGARADVARNDELGILARSLNRMAGRVEDTVITLRRFVSDAAHEIHTPLTALRTNLELARQDVLAGKDEHVVQAQAQVERLEALTAGLLDLSRIESGTQTPRWGLVHLVPLVEEVSELYASRAEQAGLAFELSALGDPVPVLGDEAQLRCVLTNLLDNTLKFTPEGGSICLGLRREGEMAVLWVEDTGIGIPEADLPHLFQRFRRGRNTAAYPGSGLGLAIVKAILDRHDGQVQAEGTERGARFTVRLPIGCSEQPQANPSEP